LDGLKIWRLYSKSRWIARLRTGAFLSRKHFGVSERKSLKRVAFVHLTEAHRPKDRDNSQAGAGNDSEVELLFPNDGGGDQACKESSKLQAPSSGNFQLQTPNSNPFWHALSRSALSQPQQATTSCSGELLTRALYADVAAAGQPRSETVLTYAPLSAATIAISFSTLFARHLDSAFDVEDVEIERRWRWRR